MSELKFCSLVDGMLICLAKLPVSVINWPAFDGTGRGDLVASNSVRSDVVSNAEICPLGHKGPVQRARVLGALEAAKQKIKITFQKIWEN